MIKSFTHLVGGSAVTLLLAASASALAGSAVGKTEPPVYLICDSDPEAPLCKALAEVLTLTVKDRDVRVLPEDTPLAGPYHMTIRFVQNAQTDDRLSGHLLWTTAGGAVETGPTLELSAMDSGLTQQMLNDFAKHLLQSSNIQM